MQRSLLKLFILFIIFILPSQAEERYIVVLKKNQDTNVVLKKANFETIEEKAKRLLGLNNKLNRNNTTDSQNNNHLEKVIQNIFQGFIATINYETFKNLENNPEVELIEKDQIIRIESFQESEYTQNAIESWGIDRIDQRNNIKDQKYNFNYTGKGVHVYIIDTGINLAHKEFEFKIGDGFYIYTKGSAFYIDTENLTDFIGHGTHVAGIIAGTKHGVAKDVIIHPIKIFNENGESSFGVFYSAIDKLYNEIKYPSVINISLSVKDYYTTKFNILDKAIQSLLIDKNVPIVISAANNSSFIDTCKISPAKIPEAITVAASDQNDKHAGFSNSGKCVDLYAPGVNIISAGILHNHDYLTKSGTSMAAPFVTGTIAKYLEKEPTSTYKEVKQYIIEQSTKNKIIDIKENTPNRLLYSTIRKEVKNERDINWIIPVIDLILN